MNVLIAQLFPRQFDWLTKAYSGPHQLDFLDSAKNESIARLKAKAERADRVIVLTKFISHSHWDAIPREKVIHSDSVNMDRLLHILDTLPSESEETKRVVPSDQVKLVAPKNHVVKRLPMSTSSTREVGEFVLTTAVPLPGEKPKTKYPFEEMRVGESFMVSCADKEKAKVASTVASAYGYYIKNKAPERVYKTSTKLEGGVRCWRMPDNKSKKN